MRYARRYIPVAVFAAVCTTALLTSPQANAQSPADFYKGKTITIFVGFGAGGGYDQYSRLLARHFGDYIPGKPSIVVQNMPGAGGLLAANHVYNVAPKDGTAIAAVTQNIGMVQLLGAKGVQYDARKFNWLGAMTASNSILFVWAGSGIKTIDDAKKREVTMVGSGAASDANIYPRILNALARTKFKVISGYSGTSEGRLAIQRGEVDGMAQASYISFAAAEAEWIKNKKVNVLMQVGFEKEPDLPNVPLLLDLAKSQEDKQIATVVTLPSATGYGHWLAPGVPADRIAVLRAAYAKAARDKGLLADAAKQNLVVRPKAGNDIAALMQKAFKTPKPVLKKTATILGW
jgi:tripartite-type tricarboxylate transporter receptor subunit TctC